MYKGDIKHHTFHSHVIYVKYFPFPCYICHILSIPMLYMSYTFHSHVIYGHFGFRLLPVYYVLACFYGSSDPIQDIGCERDTNLPITRYDPTPDIGCKRVDTNLPITRYDPIQNVRGYTLHAQYSLYNCTVFDRRFWYRPWCPGYHRVNTNKERETQLTTRNQSRNYDMIPPKYQFGELFHFGVCLEYHITVVCLTIDLIISFTS